MPVATIVGPISASLADVNVATQVTAAQVLKAAPGVCVRVLCIVAGSAGVLTLNDCTSTAAAGATNEIASIPFGSLGAGKSVALNWPCSSGIVVSAVPTGGQFSLAFS